MEENPITSLLKILLEVVAIGRKNAGKDPDNSFVQKPSEGFPHSFIPSKGGITANFYTIQELFLNTDILNY